MRQEWGGRVWRGIRQGMGRHEAGMGRQGLGRRIGCLKHLPLLLLLLLPHVVISYVTTIVIINIHQKDGSGISSHILTKQCLLGAPYRCICVHASMMACHLLCTLQCVPATVLAVQVRLPRGRLTACGQCARQMMRWWTIWPPSTSCSTQHAAGTLSPEFRTGGQAGFRTGFYWWTGR